MSLKKQIVVTDEMELLGEAYIFEKLQEVNLNRKPEDGLYIVTEDERVRVIGELQYTNGILLEDVQVILEERK